MNGNVGEFFAFKKLSNPIFYIDYVVSEARLYGERNFLSCFFVQLFQSLGTGFNDRFCMRTGFDECCSSTAMYNALCRATHINIDSVESKFSEDWDALPKCLRFISINLSNHRPFMRFVF